MFLILSSLVGRLENESTDQIQGIAPVPLWARPEPRRPGLDYRSPIIADDLQMPTAPRLQHWQRAPEGRFTSPAALPGERVLYSLPPQWTCRLLPNVLN